jgi:hypothetical protein
MGISKVIEDMVRHTTDISQALLNADPEFPLILHFDILISALAFSSIRLPQISKKIASLKVSIRMDNGIRLCCPPAKIILCLFQRGLVGPFKDSITSNMKAFLINVFLDSLEDLSIVHACRFQQASEIFWREMSIGTAVGFSTAGRMLRQDLLAAEGRVASAASVAVSANVAVGVADVVPVFFVEDVVGDLVERGSPELETVFECQA